MAERTVAECRLFFTSEYFSLFCSQDGTQILERLDATV
jgi:hypothetical protein